MANRIAAQTTMHDKTITVLTALAQMECEPDVAACTPSGRRDLVQAATLAIANSTANGNKARAIIPPVCSVSRPSTTSLTSMFAKKRSAVHTPPRARNEPQAATTQGQLRRRFVPSSCLNWMPSTRVE